MYLGKQQSREDRFGLGRQQGGRCKGGSEQSQISRKVGDHFCEHRGAKATYPVLIKYLAPVIAGPG